ncbi:MAG: DUF4214 domain-containing protein [Thiovulaceae bacterium]|nr:DUF4214 domain-containing protein [Sulfurimonadaceae bacterium]
MSFTRQQVAEIYVATFGRAPDSAGLDYWVNSSGLTNIEDIASSFFDSPEAHAAYPAGTSTAQLVTTAYENLFNREPDTAGLNYWVGQLDNHAFSQSLMLQALINGALDTAAGNDATLMNNKVQVGLDFANAGLDNVIDAKTVMQSVTADSASVPNAATQIIALENQNSAPPILFTNDGLAGKNIIDVLDSNGDGILDGTFEMKFTSGIWAGAVNLGSVFWPSFISINHEGSNVMFPNHPANEFFNLENGKLNLVTYPDGVTPVITDSYSIINNPNNTSDTVEVAHTRSDGYTYNEYLTTSLISASELIGTTGPTGGSSTPITPSVLYSFILSDTGNYPTNGGLVQGNDGNFYGTTIFGGMYSHGSIFKITPAGVETTVYSFNGTDGQEPCNLIQGNDGNFYGTTSGRTSAGDTYNDGTVFKITSDGVLTTLYSFNGTDGQAPIGNLIQANDGNFYGTTEYGGTNNTGTVFKITPAGVETTLYSFGINDGINGVQPMGSLIQGNDGSFYGTTSGGGRGYQGTAFKITATGEETQLSSFGIGDIHASDPQSGLIQGSDGNFYCTTAYGGTYNDGTVLKISPNGTTTVLHSFSGGADGQTPVGNLIQANDGNFYGTTENGGMNNTGTVFKITPAGVETVLSTFNASTTGANSHGALIQGNDGNLYGTTEYGGTNNSGTLFEIQLAGVSSPTVVNQNGNYQGVYSGYASTGYGTSGTIDFTVSGNNVAGEWYNYDGIDLGAVSGTVNTSTGTLSISTSDSGVPVVLTGQITSGSATGTWSETFPGLGTVNGTFTAHI